MYFYLLDLERSLGMGAMVYWKPGRRGYTQLLGEAGQYPMPEALEIYADDCYKGTVLIPVEAVNKIIERY